MTLQKKYQLVVVIWEVCVTLLPCILEEDAGAKDTVKIPLRPTKPIAVLMRMMPRSSLTASRRWRSRGERFFAVSAADADRMCA